MKSPVVWTALVAGFLGTVVIHSQTPEDVGDPFADILDPELPRTVRVHAEFIEMPMATYTELVSKPRSSANDSDLRAKCTELIKQGEARILESLCVNAIPGQNATTESIGEFIYPSEYEPGLGGPTEKKLKKHFMRPAGSPPSWVSFETRNTGSTFEVEVQIDNNGGLIDLRTTPTLVAFTRNVVWTTWRNSETSINTTTPLFYVYATRTGITLVDGEPTFTASLSPRGDDGFPNSTRKVMVFLRADILTSKK